jgi:hypothetical protein
MIVGEWFILGLARIFDELPPATADMAVLPGVLGCRLLRRTVQVRLGSNTLHAAQAPALRAVARWYAQLHGLATAIHEISGIGDKNVSGETPAELTLPILH